MPSPLNIICQACGSNKIMRASGMTTDNCGFTCPNHGVIEDGRLPDEISNGDYVDITVCYDCGQLQGRWPKELPEEK